MAWGGNDRGPTLLAVTWAFMGLSLATTIFRLLSRTVFTRTAGADDALIVLAVLVNLAYAIAITDGVNHGYGQHAHNLDPAALPYLGHSIIIQACIGVVTYSLPKLGIVALLNRLLNPSKMTTAVLWFLAISCTFVSMLLSIVWIVQCTPRAHQWDPMRVPGSCWNPSIVKNLSFFGVAYSAFLDIVFAIYPSLVIFKLNMRLRKRVLISLTLSGGLIGPVCAIYKATLVPETDSVAGHLDATFTSVSIILFTMVEASILVIIANLPTIGPLLNFVHEQYSKIYTMATSQNLDDPEHGRSAAASSSDVHGVPAYKTLFRPSESSRLDSQDSRHDSNDVPLVTVSLGPTGK